MPLSSAEAVLRYASDFIPSWAGAISIDLLPAVLVFMLSIAHGAMRRQEQKLPFAERITAAELLEALQVQKALQTSGIDIEAAVSSEAEGAVQHRQLRPLRQGSPQMKGPRQ